MWRRISGIILIVFGLVILATELFFIIALDRYLLYGPAFTILRIFIAVALIGFGVRLLRKPEPYDFDDWE
jgi:hypothetical protein